MQGHRFCLPVHLPTLPVGALGKPVGTLLCTAAHLQRGRSWAQAESPHLFQPSFAASKRSVAASAACCCGCCCRYRCCLGCCICCICCCCGCPGCRLAPPSWTGQGRCFSLPLGIPPQQLPHGVIDEHLEAGHRGVDACRAQGKAGRGSEVMGRTGRRWDGMGWDRQHRAGMGR